MIFRFFYIKKDNTFAKIIFMKKILFILLFLFIYNFIPAQENSIFPASKISLGAFENGEFLEFKTSFLFLTAFVSLEVKEKILNNFSTYEITGLGKTTGLARLFFKVDDFYQSYFDLEKGVPLKFIRNINENGYTRDVEINFNHKELTAEVFDKEKNTREKFSIYSQAQDLISMVFYLRRFYDFEKIKKNQKIIINSFFDNENYPFEIKYLGKEIIKTKFGKIECLKFSPTVIQGRVFKKEEALSVWISNDRNKIPLRFEAKLSVVNLRADLNKFYKLKYPFKISVN